MFSILRNGAPPTLLTSSWFTPLLESYQKLVHYLLENVMTFYDQYHNRRLENVNLILHYHARTCVNFPFYERTLSFLVHVVTRQGRRRGAAFSQARLTFLGFSNHRRLSHNFLINTKHPLCFLISFVSQSIPLPCRESLWLSIQYTTHDRFHRTNKRHEDFHNIHTSDDASIDR